MKHSYKALAALTFLIAALSPAVPAAGDGRGTVEPMACSDAGTTYAVSNKSVQRIPFGVVWKSGPGGSLSLSKYYSETATTSVSLSGTYEVSAIVSKASVTFGVSYASSTTTAETYTYNQNIAAGKYGNAQFVNWGSSMDVKKTVINHLCDVVSVVSGRVNQMPTPSWGYYYWETNS